MMLVGSELELFFQLLLALVLGALLGLERSVAGKQAGMRTFALVAIGSCLFIIVSEDIVARYMGFGSVSPLRMAAAIVTGIGFLGAGLIIFQQELRGLTTAAAMWVASGIGMAIGYKLYLVAFFVTFLTLFVFIALWFFEHFVETKIIKKHEHYHRHHER